MKEIFIKLWQFVTKYRKRLIYWIFAFFVGQICFFGLWWIWISNGVYAVEWDSATQNAEFEKKATKWKDEVSFFRKVIYTCLYPILLVVWKLVDNSFVYWEVFGFDAVLWNLWNVVRNMANFALWFIFIFYVFKYLIWKNKSSDRKWLIMKSLIAGIWIQASWFLMAVLIDLSTIMTYGIWWLPISTLGDDSQNLYANPYVTKTVISVDMNEDPIKVYMSDFSGTNYISECATFNFKSSWGELLLLAPKYIYYKQWTSYLPTTKEKMCHFDGQVYHFSDYVDGISWPSCTWQEGCINDQNTYEAWITKVKNTLDGELDKIKDYIVWWKLLQIWDAHATGWVVWNAFSWIHYDDKNIGLDVNNEVIWGEWGLKRLQETLDGSYVWVFSSLYVSLLDAWYNMRLTNSWDSSLYAGLLDGVMSFLHMLAIGIPLLAMVIVFIMRIGILWMAIALSPLIVLLEAFGLFDSDNLKSIKILDYLKLKNLIWIIFSPVVICFAISVSTVLVRIINNMNWQGVDIADTRGIMWWLIELELGGFFINLWKLIWAAIWVAITWFLVWAAVQSSKLWESWIVKSLKELATSAIWSAPIVPVPVKWENWKLKMDFVWASAATQILPGIKNNLENKLREEDREAVEAIIDPEKAKQKAEAKKFSTYKTQLLSADGKDWMTKSYNWLTFNALSEENKKAVIDDINHIQEKEKREKFKGGNIKIGNVDYEWDETDSQYKTTWK